MAKQQKKYELTGETKIEFGSRDISRSNAFLSQRKRHSPSMATRLLERGAPWTVISAVYCLAMGFPSSWNDTRLKATATPSSRKSRRNSSSQQKKPSETNHDEA